MFSRCWPLGIALLCGAVRCEAAPLSFNGVQLRQKWDEFLKAHPNISFYRPDNREGYISAEAAWLRHAHELARARKVGAAWFLDSPKNTAFWFTLYNFQDHKLVRLQVTIDPSRYNRKKEVDGLRKPSEEVLSQLGTPDGYGVVDPKVSPPIQRQLLLVWKNEKQCAYAEISWPDEERGESQFFAVLLNRPWGSLRVTAENPLQWPRIVPANSEDETRRRQLFALMEQIRPRSTDNINLLRPIPPRCPPEAEDEES